MQARVLLADDRAEVRLALRLLLEVEAGFSIAAEVSSAEMLLVGTERVQPDLILLDWELPGLRQTDPLSELRRVAPRTPVIAISGRPEAREEALAAGADAFICKGNPPDQLLLALAALSSQVVPQTP